jgi:hypothetical protein
MATHEEIMNDTERAQKFNRVFDNLINFLVDSMSIDEASKKKMAFLRTIISDVRSLKFNMIYTNFYRFVYMNDAFRKGIKKSDINFFLSFDFSSMYGKDSKLAKDYEDLFRTFAIDPKFETPVLYKADILIDDRSLLSSGCLVTPKERCLAYFKKCIDICSSK